MMRKIALDLVRTWLEQNCQDARTSDSVTRHWVVTETNMRDCVGMEQWAWELLQLASDTSAIA